jgi:hypothetical protein
MWYGAMKDGNTLRRTVGYLARSATKSSRLPMADSWSRYSPVIVILLCASLVFGLLGGAESIVAFWAIVAIPMTVLLVVALVEKIAINLRYFIAQLINRRKNKQ